MRLKILQVGEPVLRQAARTLSREEVLEPAFSQLVEHMQETMRDAPGVGLAAPQVGLPIQVVVIEDPEDYHSQLSAVQLAARDRRPVPFHVLINPEIVSVSGEPIEFYEGCLSLAGFSAMVPRFPRVTVDAWNVKAELIHIEASGWYARILQHEIDHLHGKLYVDRMHTRTLTSVENFSRYWKEVPLND